MSTTSPILCVPPSGCRCQETFGIMAASQRLSSAQCAEAVLPPTRRSSFGSSDAYVVRTKIPPQNRTD
jgi:hypothetical protein